MNSNELLIDQTPLDVFGKRLGRRLNEATEQLPYEVTERLRAARVQAVEKRIWVLQTEAKSVFFHYRQASLAGSAGGASNAWWHRISAAGLLLTLALGLVAINLVQDELGARELADIDAAILTDDLPPSAYVDAGFAQYLKSANRQEL